MPKQAQVNGDLQSAPPEGPVSVLDFRDHTAGSIGETIFLEENSRFSIGFLK